MKLVFLMILSLIFVKPAVALEEKHEAMRGPHTEVDEKENHGNEEHENNVEEFSNVGPEKAVLEADSKRGFRLSEIAGNRIGVKRVNVSSLPAQLPPQAIVRIKDEIGIYRFRDGWFKLIHGDVKGTAFIPEKRGELKAGDEVAIQGVGLLRITELDVFSAGNEGHGH